MCMLGQRDMFLV